MPPVPAEAFVRELRALPASDRTAFVAALWSARGWKTTVEDGRIVAERDGRRRRIRVVDPGRFGTPDLAGLDSLVVVRDRDRVRAAASEADIEYVSPADLRDLLLYGIDRDRASELYDRYVGRSLARDPPASGADEESERGGVIDAAVAAIPAVSGSRRALVALLLLGLVGVALAGPSIPGGSTPAQSPITVSDVTPAEENAGAIGAASPTPTDAPGLLPGVTSEGVVGVQALAEAHVEGVRNRSRVRSLTVTGPPETDLMRGTMDRNLTTRVANESHYRHRGISQFEGSQGNRTGEVDVYADGEVVYQWVSTTNGYSRTTVADRPASSYDANVAGYLYRFFLGADSTVVTCAIDYDTDCPTYRIEIEGGPPSRLENEVEEYRALAIVSDQGVITTMRVEYTVIVDGEREPVRLALDTRFESVDPAAPNWLSTAKNATGNGTETPVNGTETPVNGTEAPTD